jgi:hypothetical protein
MKLNELQAIEDIQMEHLRWVTMLSHFTCSPPGVSVRPGRVPLLNSILGPKKETTEGINPALSHSFEINIINYCYYHRAI